LFGEPEDWFAAELERCRATPRVVMLGTPAARLGPDGTLPIDLATIIPAIAQHGITAWLSIRGPIAPTFFDALVMHREKVRVTVGLPTLDPVLAQAIDPTAATPIAVQDAIASLVERGVAVDAALEPLLPNLSDAPGELRLMLGMLANLAVEQITASYLVLHEGDAERLQAALEPEDAESVLASYEDGVTMRDGKSTARFLSKAKRQRGYATLIAQAAELGVTVRVSSFGNPDFRGVREEMPSHSRSLQQSFRDRIGP
jgi:DNA repair photolyase